MRSVEKAVQLCLQWSAERGKDREAIVGALGELAAVCERAKGVWQGYLDAPGAPGDRWALVTWIGPQRAKQLHELNLEAKDAVERIARAAGPEVDRFDQLEDEDVVVMAFRQLKDGESGPDAAKTAVTTLNERVAQLKGWAEKIRATPPAKKTAANKPATKAAGKKKPAAAKKAAKKSAQKKSAKKSR